MLLLACSMHGIAQPKLSRPAEPATLAANPCLLQSLPFADPTDVDEARRGFIASLPEHPVRRQSPRQPGRGQVHRADAPAVRRRQREHRGRQHWPSFGTARIDPLLRQQRDLYPCIHDQRVRLLGLGLQPREITETVQLPDRIATAWNAPGHCGTVSHNPNQARRAHPPVQGHTGQDQPAAQDFCPGDGGG